MKKLGQEDEDEQFSALGEQEMWRSVTGTIKLVEVSQILYFKTNHTFFFILLSTRC